MSGILTQIGDALAIPRNQPGNKHIIQEIPVQDGLVNNNNTKKEINDLARIINDRERPNLALVNRNQNADEVLVNMQQN